MMTEPVFQALLLVVFGILSLSFFLAFYRLLRGPSVPDRVVAMDLITALTVGMIAVYSIISNKSVFLDAVVVMALFSFLGTIAFAKYLERKVFK